MPTSSIPASGGGGLRPLYQKFTSSGTFTLPDGYGSTKPLLIDIQVIGGGGGGSSAKSNAVPSTSLILQTNQIDYFGNGTQFYSAAYTMAAGSAQNFENTNTGSGGGSGGLAKTQMWLTSNLTITVGAAGAQPGTGTPAAASSSTLYFEKRDMNNSNGVTANRDAGATMAITFPAAGSGGTSTAGAVSATGGNGANYSANWNVNLTATNWSRANGYTPTVSAFTINQNYPSGTVGTGGQPAGSNGGATPLLGALAGGSGTATPVYGAFGVGGKRGDVATHSGVDGTGGGHGSIGASGAVIITYWA